MSHLEPSVSVWKGTAHRSWQLHEDRKVRAATALIVIRNMTANRFSCLLFLSLHRGNSTAQFSPSASVSHFHQPSSGLCSSCHLCGHTQDQKWHSLHIFEGVLLPPGWVHQAWEEISTRHSHLNIHKPLAQALGCQSKWLQIKVYDQKLLSLCT